VQCDAKLAGCVVAAKPVLVAAGGEPALQLAQLVALEWLLGVALPERTKEARAPSQLPRGFFSLCTRCRAFSPRGTHALPRT
jgi:hypothetical protein